MFSLCCPNLNISIRTQGLVITGVIINLIIIRSHSQMKFLQVKRSVSWLLLRSFWSFRFSFENIYIIWEYSESRIYRFYDKKVVICHPLFHYLELWKLLVTLIMEQIYRQLSRFTKIFFNFLYECPWKSLSIKPSAMVGIW